MGNIANVVIGNPTKASEMNAVIDSLNAQHDGDTGTHKNITVPDAGNIGSVSKADALTIAANGGITAVLWVKVTDYIVATGGLRVGTDADPGTNNISVANNITVGGIIEISGSPGLHSLSLVNTGTDCFLTIGNDERGWRVGVRDFGGGDDRYYIHNIDDVSYPLTLDGSDVMNVTGVVKVSDYVVAIGGLKVGADADPGADNLVVAGFAKVTDYIVATGGLKVGADADPGADNLVVAGFAKVTDYVVATGGLKVGADADPGTDNLIVAGFAKVTNYVVATGGLKVGADADPGTDNLVVDGTLTMVGLAGANPATHKAVYYNTATGSVFYDNT